MKSQSNEILDYLMTGKSLTVMDAVRLFNTPNLRSRISDLKKEGHDIVAEAVHKNGKTFNRYYLIQPKTLEALESIKSNVNQKELF